MKKNIFLLLFVLSVFIISCKKNLTELNINPNEVNYVEPALLFKQSLKAGAGSYNSDVNVEQWGLMNWVMFMAAKGGVVAGEEYVVPGSKDAVWNEQYANALMYAQETLNLYADSANYCNKIAAARIWKVFLFHRIVDLWGEIPYSEALKGYSDLKYMPKYDTQKFIYYDMLNELKEAANMIDPTKEFFDASEDLVYKGDVLGWKKFANSLRLRLAVRIKFVDNQKYRQELSDIQNLDLISENSLSATFPFNSDRKNHLFEAFFTNQAGTQNNPSKFFVDMLVNSNDPRISIFLEKTLLHEAMPWIPEYRGVPNLLENNSPEWNNFEENWGDISSIGDWFLRNETPGVFMSFAEVCFLKAEAALDGYFQGDAQSFYEQGVRQNIDFYLKNTNKEYEITQSMIDNYVSALSPVDLENIITQKWITFAFENGYEAYAEYRRTGFPPLKKFDGTDINKNIFPYRFPYPASEITLNGENYAEAVQRQGADNEFTKLWWQEN